MKKLSKNFLFSPELMKKKGFTLVELLVAMTILAVLVGVSVARFRQFNRAQIVKEAAKSFKADLRMAQSKAVTGQKPASGCDYLKGYTVKLQEDGYRLLALCDSGEVVLPEPYDGLISLPSQVTFSAFPASLLFKVLGNGVEISGNVSSTTVVLTGFNGMTTAEVVVTEKGEIT